MSIFDVVSPSICESGKIKLGQLGEVRKSKSGGDYRMPVKLDNFLITTLHRDSGGQLIQDSALMDELKKEYAESDGKIRQLPITVLSNDINDVMQSAWVSYIGKKCAARSDGKEITYFCRGGKWLQHPIVEPHTEAAVLATDQQKRKLFKLHSVFNCIVMSSRCRFGGLYRMRTTSIISARQLLGSLMQISELTGGVLRGLPLRLIVRPMQVTPEELNGKSTTVFVTHVELIGKDLMAIQKIALERARFELENRQQINTTAIQYKKLLALPGVNESPHEQEEIAEEFHPEADGNERVPPSTVDPLVEKLGLNGTATAKDKEPDKEPDAKEPERDDVYAPMTEEEERLASMEEWASSSPPK